MSINKNDCILRLKIHDVWKEYNLSKLGTVDKILSEKWIDHNRSGATNARIVGDKAFDSAFIYGKGRKFEIVMNTVYDLINSINLSHFYITINDCTDFEFELVYRGEVISSEVFRNPTFELNSTSSIRSDSVIDMEDGEVVSVNTPINILEIKYSDIPWELNSVIYKKVHGSDMSLEVEVNINYSDKESPWIVDSYL